MGIHQLRYDALHFSLTRVSTEVPKRHALIKNGSLIFFLLLRVDFQKWEFVFGNGSLFYENGSLFYEKGSLFYKNGSLFYESGS